jgi:heme-degrading monooxygenase HmoA
MIARIWRGWAAEDSAERVAEDLRQGALARFASSPGNVSVEILQRPLAGGIELMTLSLWESEDALPTGVDEDHRLLVARETIAKVWQVATAPAAVARAA